MSSEVKEITVDEVKAALVPDDNEQLNNIVQDAVNATANAHQKYINALEQRLKDKDAEIEKLQTLVNEMSDYFPACIDCEGKTALGERTDKCVYEIDNTNYCIKRGITNIASIRNENRELKAEIERLKDRLSKLQCSYDCELNYRKELHKTAKAEAIKEFEEMSEPKLIALYNKYHDIANKPKKETDMYYQGRAEAIWECISINRNLVKEMVGDAL